MWNIIYKILTSVYVNELTMDGSGAILLGSEINY